MLTKTFAILSVFLLTGNPYTGTTPPPVVLDCVTPPNCVSFMDYECAQECLDAYNATMNEIIEHVSGEWDDAQEAYEAIQDEAHEALVACLQDPEGTDCWVNHSLQISAAAEARDEAFEFLEGYYAGGLAAAQRAAINCAHGCCTTICDWD